jgi:hypothetical protein
MNNLPRQMLRRILLNTGKTCAATRGAAKNLLKDACGSYRREINVLVNAIEERVPLDLLAANRSTPRELLLARLEKRLEEQTAMTAEAASWAVGSWALALGIATDAEIEAREKSAKSSPPISSAEKILPNNPADNSNFPNDNRTKPVQPPKAQTSPLPKINTPPVIRQPAKTPSPSPPVFSPKNNPPATVPPVKPQTANPPVIVKRRYGFFRSCLVVIFLLIVSSIVLFLGVPYAIEVMRETQRERDNEPPRFPVR